MAITSILLYQQILVFFVLYVHSTKVTNCLVSTFLLFISVSNIIGPVAMLLSKLAKFILMFTRCKVSGLGMTHNMYCAHTYICILLLYSHILISHIHTSYRGDMYITNVNAV